MQQIQRTHSGYARLLKVSHPLSGGGRLRVSGTRVMITSDAATIVQQ